MSAHLIIKNSSLSQQSQRWLENQQEFTKNDIANRLAATSAAVAGIVSATSGDPDAINYTEVGAGVSVM